MLSPDSKALAADIQSKLAGGDFELAESLIAKFVNAIRVQFSDAADATQGQAVLEEGLENLKSWLHLSRVLRSHICSQLHATIGESRYHASVSATPSIQLQG